MSDTPRTFEYLLNAMEEAAQSSIPHKLGYGDKRKGVFDYVSQLERELAAALAELANVKDDFDAAIEQRDEMKLTLRDLTDAFADYGGPTYSNVYKNALKALERDAAMKECGK